MSWSDAAAAEIRAIVLDIDGVLTDARLGYGHDGTVVKFFDGRDEHAIKMARRQGLLVGVLSGRDDPANRQWAAKLDLSFAFYGEKRKPIAFNRLLTEHELTAAECLYIGDDVVDIPQLRRAGIGVAVADAVDEAKASADYVCEAAGGHGAVREVIVRVMRAKGLWDLAMQRYITDGPVE